MKISGTLLLLMLSIKLIGQTSAAGITGKILDGEKPILGAQIMLLKLNAIALSDSNGNFEFKSLEAGRYKLRCGFTGYENLEIEADVVPGRLTRVVAVLHPLANNVKDVIITGNLQALDKSQSIESVDVLTANDFIRNPVSNVFDALASATGIYCDIDQGLTNPVDININGLEGNFTMFTIDGVPAMNNLAGIFALSAFPVTMVDNIQIEKGSNSTAYGSDALAGVINIITKDPATAPAIALNTMLTSKLEDELGLTAAFHLKKVHTLFSIAADNMNYRWDINHDNFMDIPLVNRVSFYNKWSFIRRDNRIAVIYGRYLFEDRFAGQMNVPGRLTGSNQYYAQQLRTWQWQAGFQYQLPVKERMILIADYSEHYQQARFDTAQYHGTLRNVYTQLSWNKKAAKHELTAGLSYRLRYYSDNTALSDVAVTGIGNFVHTAGVYVQDEIHLNGNHAVYFGARFDYSNLGGPMAAPRFAYKWNTTNQRNVISLVAGTGYRVPNVLNEGFTALETSRQVIVPQKLKTEYSVSLNLNYTHTHLFSTGALKFEGGIFGIYLIHFVEPDYSDDSAAVIYNNSSGGGSIGFNGSLEYAFKFPLRLGANFSYNYVFELDTSGGETELETPTHCPYFTANYFISYTLPRAQLTFDLTGNVISPMLLATVPNDFRPSNSPWFSIMNIQVTKKFKKGFELFAGVKNLLNFVQQSPILRPEDPFNRYVAINNPNGYHFDTTYAYATIEGIKGFVGFRYTLR